MSNHCVKVVPIVLEKHPNADSLSLVKIGEYTVVVRTSDWDGVQSGVYIEPDYVVPADNPLFSFLGECGSKLITNNGVTGYRVKCKRLRGIMSMGLLVPTPPDCQIGDDVMERMGIARFEPHVPLVTGGEACAPPRGFWPVYDVESAWNFANVMNEGEDVVITEKIHGASGRYVFKDDQIFCGSRREWKKNEPGNLWWRALAATPGLEIFLRDNPGIAVYGEVFGQVQDLTYGHKQGQVSFAAFDLLRGNEWVPFDEALEMCIQYFVPWVPILYRGKYSKDMAFSLADGWSKAAGFCGCVDQIREGIVVRAIPERTCPEIGRVQLKVVSSAYLARV